LCFNAYICAQNEIVMEIVLFMESLLPTTILQVGRKKPSD
jgi:hypothetical protein